MKNRVCTKTDNYKWIPIEKFDTSRKEGQVILKSRHYEGYPVIDCYMVKYCHAATHYSEIIQN